MKTFTKISRLILATLFLLGSMAMPQAAHAATNYSFFYSACAPGGPTGLFPVSGQDAFAGCTITVYLHGTSTLAGLFSNATGTVMTNPIVLKTASGTVTTSGTTVTWVSGSDFNTATGAWINQTINIAGVGYNISAVGGAETTITTTQTLATNATAVSYTVRPQVSTIFAADGQYDVCVTHATSTPVLQSSCTYGVTLAAGPLLTNGQKAFLTADFSDASSTALQAITGLTFVLPSTFTNPVSFHCALNYSQATGAVSDAFGIGVLTTAPTRVDAQGTVFTSQTVTTTSGVAQNLANLTSTTPTAIVTFTPGATSTVYNALLDGVVQPAGGGAATIQFYASQATAGNLITVKAGSYCSLY